MKAVRQRLNGAGVSASVCWALLVGCGGGCVALTPEVSAGDDVSLAPLESALHAEVASLWGSENVALPAPSVWVEYEADLGERHVIDFERGIVTVQLLVRSSEDLDREAVALHLRQGVRNSALSAGVSPYEMQRRGEIHPVRSAEKARTYAVQRGDTLWRLAKQFKVTRRELAAANGLSADDQLQIGQMLSISAPPPPHDMAKIGPPSREGAPPVLAGQLKMQSGEQVTAGNAETFASEVCSSSDLSVREIVGQDGIPRTEVSVTFPLAEDHLQIRAQRVWPLVSQYAREHAVDPAVVMAIVHTESHFNPRARSSAPAYGLMQIVPRTAGREATLHLSGKERTPSVSALYEPETNIQLGTAYLHVLEHRYFDAVNDPVSRTYCAIAAYNGGPTAVRRAFGRAPSVKAAAGRANALPVDQVYATLLAQLPSQQTREYLSRVWDRSDLYRAEGTP